MKEVGCADQWVGFVGVFVVHPRLRLRLLSIDVAERDVVGAKEVCGGVRGFFGRRRGRGAPSPVMGGQWGDELAAGGRLLTGALLSTL